MTALSTKGKKMRKRAQLLSKSPLGRVRGNGHNPRWAELSGKRRSKTFGHTGKH